MHDSELMMTIAGASAALAGLVGVIIGQIMQSGLAAHKKRRFSFPFIVCFVSAVLATSCAVGWLGTQDDLFLIFGVFFFALLMAWLAGNAVTFWLLLGEEECRSPAGGEKERGWLDPLKWVRFPWSLIRKLLQ